jgi:hypothetical protein
LSSGTIAHRLFIKPHRRPSFSRSLVPAVRYPKSIKKRPVTVVSKIAIRSQQFLSTQTHFLSSIHELDVRSIQTNRDLDFSKCFVLMFDRRDPFDWILWMP